MAGCGEYFLSWAEDEKNVDFDFMGGNLYEVYENFIERKYAVYFKKYEITEEIRQKKDKKDSEMFNRKLAESLVLNRKAWKPDESVKEWIGLIGLVHGEYVEFIHFTFCDYYFAQIFAKYIFSKTIPECFRDKMIFLIKEIFVKEQYEMICHFLNVKLKAKLTDSKLEKFANLFLQNKGRLLEPYTTSDSVLAIAARRGHENIFNFIYSIYFRISSVLPSYRLTNILNQRLVYETATNGHLQVWSMLLNIFRSLDDAGKWENPYYQFLTYECIYLATFWKGRQLQEGLLKKLEEMFLNGDIYRFITKHDIFEKIIRGVDSPEMLNLILKIGEKYLDKKERYKFLAKARLIKGPNSLFLAATKNDSKFMELLLKKFENIITIEEQRKLFMKKDYSDLTILQKAARIGDVEIFKLLMKVIEHIFDSGKQEEYLMLANKNGLRALDLAVHHNYIEIVKLLVEKGEKIMKAEVFFKYLFIRKPTDDVNPLLQHNYMETIEFLFRKVEETFHADDQRRWLMMFFDNFRGPIFHRVCTYGDFTLLNLTFEKLQNVSSSEKLGEFFMIRNENNDSCLHLAIKNGRIEVLKSFYNEIERFLSLEDRCELITTRNNDGRTILHIAGLRKDPDILKFLMKKCEETLKPDKQLELLKMRDNRGTTLFHLIVEGFPVEFIKSYVETFEDQCFLFLKDNNILHSALSNESPDVFELFLEILEKTVDLKKQRELLMGTNMYNENFLHMTARKNQTKFIQLFFEKIENVLSTEDQRQLMLMKNKYTGNTVLHQAAIHKQADLLELLFEKMSKISDVEKQKEFLTTTNSVDETVLRIALTNFSSMKPDSAKLILKKAEYLLTYDQILDFLYHSFVSDDVLSRNFSNDSLKMYLETGKKLLRLEDQIMLMTHFSNPILHAIAVDKGDFRILETLFEYIEVFPIETQREILQMTNKENDTVLYAVLSSRKCIQYETVAFLLGKFEKILTLMEIQKLYITEDIFYSVVLTGKELDIIKLVFHEAEEILKDDFRRAFEINQKGTVLHAAVLGNEYNVVKFIFDAAKDILSSEMLENFLMATNDSGRNVLHIAAEKIHKIQPNRDFGDMVGIVNRLADQSYSMHLFLKEGKKILTPEKLRHFIMAEDHRHQTSLHLAANVRNLEAVKLILQEAEECLSFEDLREFITVRDIRKQTALEVSSSETVTALLTEFVDEKINSSSSLLGLEITKKEQYLNHTKKKVNYKNKSVNHSIRSLSTFFHLFCRKNK